ncbi:hypothetical protein PAECIP111893_03340 [Paenibacillus plantiphilus]|uniref:Glycosyl transferase family 28 C-terminal domain-containing protein n=2 Tax=Paenibacillus plantiphilus TaxID=2905650 RepID=A0ABN8GK36_9BACL|nr:hypothetical protein PAECIP111893_03340 [Paenibacillus plantiphilus]
MQMEMEKQSTICYYISDYGYGHAARGIALIRRLLETSPRPFRFIVCCSRPLSFVRESLRAAAQKGLEFRDAATDLGYFVQENSMEPDLDRLQVEYRSYMSVFPDLIARERDYLLQNKVDMVLSDISPVPIKAASQAGITSIGMSNFTWYTAYEKMLDSGLLAPLYDAYLHMDYFISLAGSEEPPWGRRGYVKAGFFCRAPEKREWSRLQSLHGKGKGKDDGALTVFVALGMDIHARDMKDMAMWKDEDCTFIVSSHMDASGPNVVRIPPSYTESQNYLALADIVITKPGWGVISEAVHCNKPLLMVKRDLFMEDLHTTNALTGRHPYRMIGWDELKGSAITRQFVDAIYAAPTGDAASDSDEQLQRICAFLHEWV